MARRVDRAEIWMYEVQPPDKRRPVVVLSRQEAIEVLNAVIVAPVTSTFRGSPAEVELGTTEGLKDDSVANLGAVQTVAKRRLVRYLGRVTGAKMSEICRALALATGCDGNEPA